MQNLLLFNLVFSIRLGYVDIIYKNLLLNEYIPNKSKLIFDFQF